MEIQTTVRGTRYSATIHSGNRIDIYEGRVWAGSGRVFEGQIIDCAADLGDDVYDALQFAIRAGQLLADVSDLDTGDGNLRTVVEQALRDDPTATASDVRAIWQQATEDATAERERA